MSDPSPGIEVRDYRLAGARAAGPFTPVLVGVVGSGNLEILVEPIESALCEVHVETSARGFGAIWDAVVSDFHRRHPLSGLRVSVHDMGATPAVVSLRLDQAIAELS
ncbi:malonate decarboxylase acyl carrier protein [Leptothrix discophora]|uniref:Malonate decarboxylase acyl carrier protein n=1 Tax=Leptothrix discophora TaxID=89 RepID=A0ABT9G2B8_LEPDI|nr:malonate decarboxylase acyl carrier protein [Leptothrix discophora]MDP4300422.1 malonate decarboxylase acyl carrier protein [Leptothrix discophora]